MLDATKSDEQRRLLEHELDAVGIRLNKSKPDVVFKKRTTGGITVRTEIDATQVAEPRMVCWSSVSSVQYNGQVDEDRRENDSDDPCRI